MGDTICPKCERPAPRLISWRQANHPERVRECPRCVYQPERYQGDTHETLPEADLEWYREREVSDSAARAAGIGEDLARRAEAAGWDGEAAF